MAYDPTLNPDIWIYSNEDDIIDIITSDTIQIGLRGNDHFYVYENTDHRILNGGIGNDAYTVYGSAIIFDFQGSNIVEMPETSYYDYYVATIDGGYAAVLYNFETKDYLIFTDIFNSSYYNDYIYFSDESFNLGYLLENVYNDPLYVGDVPWYHLSTLGLEALNTGDALDAINLTVQYDAYWQTRADVEYIALLYEAALNRIPDIEGLNFWIDVFEGGYNFDDVSGYFLGSSEFAKNFGDPTLMSTEQFVDVMYMNVLGREADQSGYEFWVGQVESNNLSKTDILLFFSTSNENFTQADYLDTLYEVAPGNWAFLD